MGMIYLLLSLRRLDQYCHKIVMMEHVRLSLVFRQAMGRLSVIHFNTIFQRKIQWHAKLAACIQWSHGSIIHDHA